MKKVLMSLFAATGFSTLVPEPGTCVLLSLGALGLARRRRTWR